MKISYNWLREYINTDKTAEEAAELLTNCGLEVESTEKFEAVKGGLKGVVVGEVLTKTKHPNADKLSVTTVDIGDGRILNIVCGAANVEAGQKVPEAIVGTTLYMGKGGAENAEEEKLEIKKTKIRGVVSEGMICAEDELGLGISHEGIMVLEAGAEKGMEASEYFHLTDDSVFEIGLTPNRPDATSHIGVARDLYAVQKSQKFSDDEIRLSIPNVGGFVVDERSKPIEVIVDDKEACKRYSGVTISDITIKESPEWIKNRLKSIGLRPINNIVDVTNYVMMETGQPLHAFDADKIKGNKIIVKKLPKGSKFTTLDKVERELTEDDLMICNEEAGMCIAGVYGGLESGISEGTRVMFLESANFSPGYIRRTSKYHGLSTDSSFRFERGADPNITVYALKRAAMLIKETSGGRISSDIVDVYPNPIENKEINVTLSNINKLIGKKIEKKTVVTILESLGIKVLKESINQDDTGLLLSVPPFKSDVKRESDIIEEVLRIYGYNNVEIPEKVMLSVNYGINVRKESLQNKVSDYLSNNGFYEIYCNSLIKSSYSEIFETIDALKNVKVLNPISKELNVMRQTLLFGGLETIEHNYNRKQQDLRLYEFGKTYQYINSQSSENKKGTEVNTLKSYEETNRMSIFMTGKLNNESWDTNNESADFYDIKFHINNILLYSGTELSEQMAEKFKDEIFETGVIYKDKAGNEILRYGKLSEKVHKSFDVKQEIYYAEINWDNVTELSEKHEIKYKELAKYPEVRRDIAMLIDKSVEYADIEKAAYQTEKKLLKKVDLFDIYEGENIEKGKKSYAISLILQNSEKTLTDYEVDKVMEKIRAEMKERFDAIIR